MFKSIIYERVVKALLFQNKNLSSNRYKLRRLSIRNERLKRTCHKRMPEDKSPLEVSKSSIQHPRNSFSPRPQEHTEILLHFIL